MLAIKTDAGPQLCSSPRRACSIPPRQGRPGAEIEVTGSKVKMTGQQQERDVILASLVKTGGKEYRIRNDQGQIVDKDGKPLTKAPR